MPEGDTITKLGRFLQDALVGQAVQRVRLHPAFGESRGPARIEAVSTLGKHLYLAFDHGWVLRSHLGLYGSWHRYRVGEPWRRPRRQLSILVETAEWSFVCFNAKEAQWLKRAGFALADQQQRLGPDLISEPLDASVLLERARGWLAPSTLLVDVLLDQRLAAGIGNVYKSEVLFLEGCCPQARLAELSDEGLFGLYRRAAELLRQNLGGGARRTRFARDGLGSLWVYGRLGRPCFRCRTPISRAIIGARPRSTYWCESCQRAAPNTRVAR
jgi:endonuclease-8